MRAEFRLLIDREAPNLTSQCLFSTMRRMERDQLDLRIANWPGGRIRIFERGRQVKSRTVGKDAAGNDVLEVSEVVTLEFLQEAEAKPFGPGLALLAGSGYEHQPVPGVLVDIDVRDGRLQ